MRVLLGVSLALVAALALPGRANAQGGDYPTRIRPPGEPARAQSESTGRTDEARRVMNAFALCIARRNRRDVDHFLAQPMGAPSGRGLAPRLASSDCLYNADLRFASTLFRGSLFEAIYQIDYGRRGLPNLATAPVISYGRVDAPDLSAEERSHLALHDFADCVVRVRPDEVRTLVLSRVASREEGQALAGLNSALSGCLVVGAEVRFSRAVLRGFLAESLYRLTAAVSPPAALVRR
jgi:hypothetical protein